MYMPHVDGLIYILLDIHLHYIPDSRNPTKWSVARESKVHLIIITITDCTASHFKIPMGNKRQIVSVI